MKHFLGIILIVIAVAGCTSESEEMGIQAIGSYYGCAVSSSKGFSTSTSEGTVKYVELRLRGGEVNNLPDAEVPASYSALTLYQNLSQEEKQKYTHIKIVIQQQTGNSNKTTEYEFAIGKLKMIAAKLAKVKELQDNLKRRQYEQLMNKMAPIVLKDFDKQPFFAQLDTLAKEFGEINDCEFQSFDFFESEVNNEPKDLLQVKGVLLRSSKNLRLNVIFSPQAEDNRIYGVNFK